MWYKFSDSQFHDRNQFAGVFLPYLNVVVLGEVSLLTERGETK